MINIQKKTKVKTVTKKLKSGKKIITELLNNILHENKIPDNWKVGIIRPI